MSSTLKLRTGWIAYTDCIDAFEVARQSDPDVCLDAFLDGVPVTHHRAVLAELVCCDLDFRWREGHRPFVEDYLKKYPTLGSENPEASDTSGSVVENSRDVAQSVDEPEDVAWLRRMVLAEMEVRQSCGDVVERDEVDSRFHGLLATDTDLGHVTGWDALSKEDAEEEQVADSACNLEATQLNVRREGVSPKPEMAATQDHGFDTALLPMSFGRYRVQSKLGSGAMGSVWLAHDTVLDRKVALKVPSAETLETESTRERFFLEARAAAGIRHRAVCPVFDAGEIDGLGYLAMAYLPGQSLQELLAGSNELMNVDQAVAMTAELARGLHAAHAQHVIHRDLKPGNVMIDETGQVLITDFGLARRDVDHEVELTQYGSVVGTPAYMSPEQFSGNRDSITPATDQYSLGVVLYRLLTGDIPFRGSLIEIAGQVARDLPPRPSSIVPALSESLDDLVVRAMAKVPEERFSSADEFADELDAWLTRSPESAGEAKPVNANSTVGSKSPTDDSDLSAIHTAGSSRLFVAATTAVTLACAVGMVSQIEPFAKGFLETEKASVTDRAPDAVAQNDIIQSKISKVSGHSPIEPSLSSTTAKGADSFDPQRTVAGLTQRVLDTPQVNSLAETAPAAVDQDSIRVRPAAVVDASIPEKSVNTRDEQHPMDRADSIELRIVYQRADEQPRVSRQLTDAGVVLKNGDLVRVEGNCPPGVYPYLFWYDASGHPTRLWPTNDQVLKQLPVESIHSPALETTGINQEWWPLAGERGFDAVVLAWTRKRLSPTEIAQWEDISANLAITSAELTRGLGPQKVISADRPIISKEFQQRLAKRFEMFSARVIGIDD